MTLILDVNVSDSSSKVQSQGGGVSLGKHQHQREFDDSECRITRARNKVCVKSHQTSSSIPPSCTKYSSQVSIKDNLIENKEKLNDLNDQILSNKQQKQKHSSSFGSSHSSSNFDLDKDYYQPPFNSVNETSNKSSEHASDPELRFTRKKLGEKTKAGYISIAAFLAILLLSGLIFYAGYLFLHNKHQQNRIFRGKIHIIAGDNFTMRLSDQNSTEFTQKAREYRERINLLISRSKYRKFYDGVEILALDGFIDEKNHLSKDLIIHFLLNFDASSTESFKSVDELKSLFIREFQSVERNYFKDVSINLARFQLKEISFTKLDDIFELSNINIHEHDILNEISVASEEIRNYAPRKCEPVTLKFCKNIGNFTTMPNLLGHRTQDEMQRDLISFREIIDSECFLHSYDFLCSLLQPSCQLSYSAKQNEIFVKPYQICRDYCQTFKDSCLSRIPQKFQPYFDCDKFPEVTYMQSCKSAPPADCLSELKRQGNGLRICDGIIDCPRGEDELSCSYCPQNSVHCNGRGRLCISRDKHCDGVLDCPDGSDERDCLFVSPLLKSTVGSTSTYPVVPHRAQFWSSGFAVYTEKGHTGKLCGEGMEANEYVKSTVAESLCKALGYENVKLSELRNDTEDDNRNYVRVLDPRAAEISFVRTDCDKRQALFLECESLECGKQSIFSADNARVTSKMANMGDWPFHVYLLKRQNHVCDGTLVSPHWVLTTSSCFQGQPKEKWTAVFGALRIGMTAPWTQKRRIIGMVKSPVEGSSVALVRLQYQIVYSDFVRPICLPDVDTYKNDVAPLVSSQQVQKPFAARYQKKKERNVYKEERRFFILNENDKSEDEYDEDNDIEMESLSKVKATNLFDEFMNNLKPETQSQNFIIESHDEKSQWKNCQTLAWSRKDHLQRIQLKINEMKACENVSITTVNSLCAESIYYKQDCTEEEFPGSPIICPLPDEKRWSIIGVLPWKVGCSSNSLEKFRLYDRVEPNSLWIRDVINSAN